MDSSDLRAVARQCADTLSAATDQDWSALAPESEWTVAAIVSHMSQSNLWYAIDLTAGPSELSTISLSISPDSPPSDLIRTVLTTAELLAFVADGTPKETRGWHPFGMTDASGYAAMGCDEFLVHTYDAALGLGLTFDPDRGLAERTLHRLFPSAPTNVDPWQALLWANGRIALPGRPRLTEWRWHCAPLEDYDHQVASVSVVNPSES